MKEKNEKFFLVRSDVLPEAMRKTIEAKELLQYGKVRTIFDAVKQVDLSRSAYYKYKDTVFPFRAIVREKIITLFFHIEDRKGTLSKLLKAVAEKGYNVLTIHQTIPNQLYPQNLNSSMYALNPIRLVHLTKYLRIM